MHHLSVVLRLCFILICFVQIFMFFASDLGLNVVMAFCQRMKKCCRGRELG